MFCKKCGRHIHKRSNFCDHCDTFVFSVEDTRKPYKFLSVFLPLSAVILSGLLIVAILVNFESTKIHPFKSADEIIVLAEADILKENWAGALNQVNKLTFTTSGEASREKISKIKRKVLAGYKAELQNIGEGSLQTQLDIISGIIDEISVFETDVKNPLMNDIEIKTLSLIGSNYSDNKDVYTLLSETFPEKQEYQKMVSHYSGLDIKRIETARRARVKSILEDYKSDGDKFSDTTFYKHPNTPSDANPRSTIFLYIGISERNEWLRMQIQYVSEEWLLVGSVKGYADGETFILSDNRFERNYRAKIFEWSNSEPSLSQIANLKKLGEASDATLRFIGNQDRVDVKLQSTEQKALLDVLSDFEALQSTIQN